MLQQHQDLKKDILESSMHTLQVNIPKLFIVYLVLEYSGLS